MIRSYPKIQSFANICKLANSRNIGEVLYEGSVKIHGTNASVVLESGVEAVTQSRTRIITPTDDNAGFSRFISNMTEPLFNPFPNTKIIIYGEWCGGNIQKNIAITGLPKMFVVFDVVKMFEDKRSKSVFDVFLDHHNIVMMNKQSVYFKSQFSIFSASINFDSTKSKQQFAELCSSLVLDVENRCPVGKFFNKEGIGEGIVWTPLNFTEGELSYSDMMFKTKGEKHSVTKVKTIVPLTDQQFEEQLKYEQFVEATVTDNRIDQSIELVNAIDRTSVGDCLRWIYNDIVTEEINLITTNRLDTKKLGKVIAKLAKNKLLLKL